MKATQDNLEFVSKLSDIDIYGINNQLYINSSIDVVTSATASVHFTIPWASSLRPFNVNRTE